MLDKYNIVYKCENSFVHRMNPLIKIFSLLVYILLWLLKYNNYLFIMSLSYVLFLILISNVKLRKYFKFLWNLKYIFIILFFYLYSIRFEFIDGLMLFLRIIFLIWHVLLILYTTTRKELCMAITNLVNIFNLFGIKKKTIFNFVDGIYCYFLNIINVYNGIFIAQELSGNSAVFGSILDKWKLFFLKIKEFIFYIKLKNKLYKQEKKNRLYYVYSKSKFKYVNRFCLLDYLVLIINVGMIIFYVLKVK